MGFILDRQETRELMDEVGEETSLDIDGDEPGKGSESK